MGNKHKRNLIEKDKWMGEFWRLRPTHSLTRLLIYLLYRHEFHEQLE